NLRAFRAYGIGLPTGHISMSNVPPFIENCAFRTATRVCRQQVKVKQDNGPDLQLGLNEQLVFMQVSFGRCVLDAAWRTGLSQNYNTELVPCAKRQSTLRLILYSDNFVWLPMISGYACAASPPPARSDVRRYFETPIHP